MTRGAIPHAMILFLVVLFPAVATAHAPLSKAMKERYELRSASCYTCHVKGKDEKTGKPLGKEHLNPFGEALHAVLKDKNLTQKLQDAKEADDESEDKVKEEVVAEFLKAIETVENEKSANGNTWLSLIKSGELDGIKLKD
ncbi:MAG: hypothetical protein KDA42_00220 [Planctomycetales bacterium]|nr:hypothetical protein [Planctomycetales bacterium]